MGTHALVLNASFEPIHVVSWQKAIQMLFQGKVEVLEESDSEVRSVKLTIRIPAVLRLLSYVPLIKKRQFIRFSRSNVFIRDNYRCQYCGGQFHKNHLTLDHVIPVVQGGHKDWCNIVTSCIRCNQHKGGRTPQQAQMKLIRQPREPEWLPKITIHLGISTIPRSWKVYFKVSADSDADPESG